MDIPSSPILAELVLKLRDQFHIHDFVETGTYLGVTARWASQNFQQVYTIEASEELWRQARMRHAEDKNIEFLSGDSREILANLVAHLVQPALYWLDAHWSAGVTYGEHDQCPLLGEIEILKNNLQNAFVLIDDADLFLSPPTRPNLITAWPDIYTVLHALKQNAPDTFVLIFENVIISVPAYARSFVATFCQGVTTQRFERKVRAERSLFNRIIYRVRRKLESTFPALKAK